uniref:Syntaxin binding protein 5L n=1 Tax=Salmo trutta TaxID=8032 RepID=A0A673ZHP0_SALTR
MKKFRKVLDGLSSSSQGAVASPSCSSAAGTPPTPQDIHVHETLVSENFHICKTVRHGFPYKPTCLAFDPVQKILAIGSRTGGIRILGRPGVDCYSQHESGAAVLQLQFLINEGALVTACADDTLHLWNLRQRRPAILHSLKFNRERITFCHLPFQSKWLYVGTERVKSSNIRFESGTVVQWDLRAKKVDFRIYYDEAIHSVSWHHEGKQFMCSHSDGSLTMWNLRNTARPIQITYPHGKILKEGRKESCKPILKVEYKTSRNSEPYIIFSGGLSYDKVGGRRPTLTIMHGKAVTVLEMDHPIVEFLVLCDTPYSNEIQDPYAVVLLLEKDFIMVDLTQRNFPIFENPYPMDIHESPVTCTAYFAECPPDIIPVLYSVGAKQKKTGYSHKEWPVSGGTWTLDFVVKVFTLQMLYKLKTSKVFENPNAGEGRAVELVEEDPYAIQMVSWCPQSRLFCVVGISAHVILYRFSKHEANTEIVSLEVRLQFDSEDVISPSETENNPCFSDPSSHSPQMSGSPGNNSQDSLHYLKVKNRPVRMPPGYQAELVVQLQWVDREPPQQITSLDINSAYGLLAFGSCNGLVMVDYIQKTILMCVSTLDLYGAADPYQRLTRSPRKNRQSTSEFCMRSLSHFYSDSKKRIRTSYQSNSLSPPLSLSPSPSSSLCLSVSLCMCVSCKAESRENSFSRSRSSSVSSIDRDTKEAVTTLQFGESYGRKADSLPTACLWVGTSLGVVLLLPISIPTEKERLEEPVTMGPSGTILMLKGSVLCFSFLDCGGTLIQSPYEVWQEPEDPDEPRRRKLVNLSPLSSQEACGDGHLAVVCSEKQAKVILMPTQAVLFTHNVTESSFLLRADVVSVCNSVCLACFCANGHVMTLRFTVCLSLL